MSGFFRGIFGREAKPPKSISPPTPPPVPDEFVAVPAVADPGPPPAQSEIGLPVEDGVYGLPPFLRLLSFRQTEPRIGGTDGQSEAGVRLEFLNVRNWPEGDILNDPWQHRTASTDWGERGEPVKLRLLKAEPRIKYMMPKSGQTGPNNKGVWFFDIALVHHLAKGEVLDIPVNVSVGSARVLVNRKAYGATQSTSYRGPVVAPKLVDVPALGSADITVRIVG